MSTTYPAHISTALEGAAPVIDVLIDQAADLMATQAYNQRLILGKTNQRDNRVLRSSIAAYSNQVQALLDLAHRLGHDRAAVRDVAEALSESESKRWK